MSNGDYEDEDETKPTNWTLALESKTFDQCTVAAPKKWLVENVIALKEDSSWYGPPGAGKSGLLLDLALHVASGRDWRGNKFIRCENCNPEEVNNRENRGVIYFALERADLTERRIAAYKQRDGLSGLPFKLITKQIHLVDPSCVQILRHTIAKFFEDTGAQPGLVIIDTWGKAIAPYDRNSAATHDMAALHLKQVRESLPGSNRFHLATIGHSGKNIDSGEGGSNSRQAHIDLEVQVSAGNAKITKGNDQAKGELTKFEFEEVTVHPKSEDEGYDDPPSWSTHIIATQAPVREARTVASKPLTGKAAQALDALKRVIAHGQDGAAHVDYWKEELTKVALIKADDKNPRTTFRRIQNSVSQHIIETDGFVRIKIPPPPIVCSVAA